ncbi:hypothetical protein LOD99_10981 [Oopsacas minuta]|uniref:Uncharacterized protein n=1 Tax=Oopsacas minuta TaxID=111878 RepID=A0AAV7KB86_9METZ|nr:hypothetical protein LOD99_10981 [Oopsacas minuta]
MSSSVYIFYKNDISSVEDLQFEIRMLKRVVKSEKLTVSSITSFISMYKSLAKEDEALAYFADSKLTTQLSILAIEKEKSAEIDSMKIARAFINTEHREGSSGDFQSSSLDYLDY